MSWSLSGVGEAVDGMHLSARRYERRAPCVEDGMNSRRFMAARYHIAPHVAHPANKEIRSGSDRERGRGAADEIKKPPAEGEPRASQVDTKEACHGSQRTMTRPCY